MASAERSRNAKMTKQLLRRAYHHSDFLIPSSFDIRHPSLAERLIATREQLAELIPQIEAADRVALDTEADSLHSYREKLCLVQISVPAVAGIADAGGHGGICAQRRALSSAACQKVGDRAGSSSAPRLVSAILSTRDRAGGGCARAQPG